MPNEDQLTEPEARLLGQKAAIGVKDRRRAMIYVAFVELRAFTAVHCYAADNK